MKILNKLKLVIALKSTQVLGLSSRLKARLIMIGLKKIQMEYNILKISLSISRQTLKVSKKQLL